MNLNCDLLVQNAHIVDPGSDWNGPGELAVRRGRVVALDRALPDDAAGRVYDARGRYVMPGLVDLHTHIYPAATFWGVAPEPIASRTGVTTWVDAGSAGAFNFDGFRDAIVRRSGLTVRAFLNISCIGLTAHDYELTNLQFCDPTLFELVANANRDVIVGAKVRMGATTCGDTGIAALERARQALDRCDLPMMVHISQAPPGPEEFAHLLHEGDVVTHCCTGQSMKLVDDAGKLKDFARAWLERGVLLDVGHGTGSFVFEVAEAMIAAGALPHFISSDVHLNSIAGPMYDLPMCLTKWLNLGMSLPDVIARATIAPARFLGIPEVGTLAPGSKADFAVFSLGSRNSTMYDSAWTARRAEQELVHHATFVAGRELPVVPDPPRPEFLKWRRAGRDDVLYAKQAEARHDHQPSQ